ncbi:hypothetical protein AAFF_G00436880 [Aldrovandia affinis]|uniref:Uncharacterized protein n=1 Tax=Aldrovandia affinis TaxID=143900 RepID=A0AAD7S827_9TELE|nr:hypothetical protein AAFF_G00436880 [Aldrovandia affinis]
MEAPENLQMLPGNRFTNSKREDLIEKAEELKINQSVHKDSDNQIPYNYIQSGGQFHTNTFMNTCVLDSLLAAIHIAAKQHPKINHLFMWDPIISAVQVFMDCGRYNEAKALWLINLDEKNEGEKQFMQSDHIDIRGYPREHLPNFLDLTCAKFNYDEERRSPHPEDHIYSMTISKFEHLGEVRALGKRINPELILVDVDGRIKGFPDLSITDDYEREFKLQFLLLGMMTETSNHMVMCTRLDGGWQLYDNMKNPLFRHVNIDDICAQDYVVHLVAYVNVSPENEKQD